MTTSIPFVVFLMIDPFWSKGFWMCNWVSSKWFDSCSVLCLWTVQKTFILWNISIFRHLFIFWLCDVIQVIRSINVLFFKRVIRVSCILGSVIEIWQNTWNLQVKWKLGWKCGNINFSYWNPTNVEFGRLHAPRPYESDWYKSLIEEIKPWQVMALTEIKPWTVKVALCSSEDKYIFKIDIWNSRILCNKCAYRFQV